jgi:hypothetical protein
MREQFRKLSPHKNTILWFMWALDRDSISDNDRDKIIMCTELRCRNVYQQAKWIIEKAESKIDKLAQWKVNGCSSGFDQEFVFLKVIPHWSSKSCRSMSKQNAWVPQSTPNERIKAK